MAHCYISLYSYSENLRRYDNSCNTLARTRSTLISLPKVDLEKDCLTYVRYSVIEWSPASEGGHYLHLSARLNLIALTPRTFSSTIIEVSTVAYWFLSLWGKKFSGYRILDANLFASLTTSVRDTMSCIDCSLRPRMPTTSKSLETEYKIIIKSPSKIVLRLYYSNSLHGRGVPCGS